MSQFARKKIWPSVAKAAKGIIWITGLVAGLSAMILWFPAAYNQIMWRQVEYDLLETIHAGNNSAYVDDILGQPTIVKDLKQTPGLIENIYIRRDYYVMTVTNEAQRVLLYSVLSCSPDFAPSFRTPLGSRARLQSVPLAASETYQGQSDHDIDLNKRGVTYMPASTVSSLGQFIETADLVGSNAARTQFWFVGVNSACGETTGFGSEPFSDLDVDSLPEEVNKNRQRLAANFYAETATEVEVYLSAEGNLSLGGEYPIDGEYTGLFVSPFHFDLPSQDEWRTSTRTF